jgi:hypothetical protein
MFLMPTVEDCAIQEIHDKCFVRGVDTFNSALIRRVIFQFQDNDPDLRRLVSESGLYNEGSHVYVPLNSSDSSVLREAFRCPATLPKLVAPESFCYAFLNEADEGEWVLDVNFDVDYFANIVHYENGRGVGLFDKSVMHS